MALKALPLALPLGGVLNGRRHTFQWAPMLILAYFAEGIVRVYSEAGTASLLAAGEIALSALFFAASVAYARLTR